MLQDSFATAAQDMKTRALAENPGEAQRMLSATASELAAKEGSFRAGDRAAMEAMMATLSARREADDAAVIEAATEALAQGTQAFAARPINHTIPTPLSTN